MPAASHLIRLIFWIPVLVPVVGLCLREPFLDAIQRTPDGVSVSFDVPYGPTENRIRRFTVLEPSSPEPSHGQPGRRIAILAVHGGSWIGGSRTEYAPQLARLARQGFVVFVADYTLARPGHPSWPAALDDLTEAVHWICRNRDRYRIDPDQLAVLGSGSGAHLALMLADHPGIGVSETASDPSSIKAVISLYGPTNLVDLARQRSLEKEPVRTLLGTDRPEWLNLARLASPLAHVAKTSRPTLLIHGLEDAWVPPSQAQELARALEEAGVYHRLILLPTARHGFEFQLGGPTRVDLLPQVLDFLDVVLHTQTTQTD